MDETIRVAVFDGGQPDIPALYNFVRRIDCEGVAEPVKKYERHGLAVTSALLFGSLSSSQPMQRPYARVDHYRVLDKNTAAEPQDSVYPVLKRIVGVLEKEHYDFINLSIGPAIPIDDDDVHPWTAKLDAILSSGTTFTAIAVGNSGEADAESRLNRIQPPSDCVNAFAVGASDGIHPEWKGRPIVRLGMAVVRAS
jgi:hypothetical protein